MTRPVEMRIRVEDIVARPEWSQEVEAWRQARLRQARIIPFMLPAGRFEYVLTVVLSSGALSAPLTSILDEAVAHSLERILSASTAQGPLSVALWRRLKSRLAQELREPVARVESYALRQIGRCEATTGFSEFLVQRVLSCATGLTEERLLELFRLGIAEAVVEC